MRRFMLIALVVATALVVVGSADDPYPQKSKTYGGKTYPRVRAAFDYARASGVVATSGDDPVITVKTKQAAGHDVRLDVAYLPGVLGGDAIGRMVAWGDSSSSLRRYTQEVDLSTLAGDWSYYVGDTVRAWVVVDGVAEFDRKLVFIHPDVTPPALQLFALTSPDSTEAGGNWRVNLAFTADEVVTAVAKFAASAGGLAAADTVVLGTDASSYDGPRDTGILLDDLNDGTVYASLDVTDGSGNGPTSSSTTLAVTRQADLTPPSITAFAFAAVDSSDDRNIEADFSVTVSEIGGEVDLEWYWDDEAPTPWVDPSPVTVTDLTDTYTAATTTDHESLPRDMTARVRVSDALGNWSDYSSINPTIPRAGDVTPPVIASFVTDAPDSSEADGDWVLNVAFSSDESGEAVVKFATSSGGLAAADTIVLGADISSYDGPRNTGITLDALNDGTIYASLVVTDASDNASDTSNDSQAVTRQEPPDTTPPTLTFASISYDENTETVIGNVTSNEDWYISYRNRVDSGTWTSSAVGDTLADDQTVIVDVSGESGGALIEIEVGGEDAAGNAATAVSDTISVDRTPSAPTGLAASDDEDSQTTVTWTDPAIGDVDSFSVYVGTGTGGPYTLYASGIDVTAETTTVSGLTNGSTYYIVATVTDDGANESAQSSEVNATPAAAATSGAFEVVFSIDTSGDATERTVTLPLNSGNGSTFDCTVDWGDGSADSEITAVDDADRIHEYAYDAGGSETEYTVSITGTLEGWSFNNSGDNLDDVVYVASWGSSPDFGGFKYMEHGFRGCSLDSIASGPIPASGDGVTTFAHCFRDNSLTSIPSGLFDNHTSVTSFAHCFRDNSLTSIPSGLFDNNTIVTSFYMTFGDNSLTSIPSGLFDNNTSVTNFGYTFYNNSLTSIPSGLFDNNASVTSFYRTFGGNEDLQIPSDVFPVTTAYWEDRNVDFTSMFERSGTFGGTQGTAPALWTIDFGTGTIDSTDVFAGHDSSSLSNYGDIPAGWR